MLYEIEFPLASLPVDELEAALFELGALSVTLADRGDEPVLEPRPGEIRLWSDTLVRALFDDPGDGQSTIAELARRFGAPLPAGALVRPVAPRDWERVWLEDWKPMRFGRRLWVCPTAAQAPDDPEAVVVRLDPGLAFGTGTHPTTALCLRLLDALPVAGSEVIDYGCGSGILGIAALKLGAARVTGVDLDPQALIASRDNALGNGVSSRLELQGIPPTLQPADLVFANILAQPLIELAPTLKAACRIGADLVLSGLLKSQAYAVKAAYTAAFDMVRIFGQDDWCCIHARRVS